MSRGDRWKRGLAGVAILGVITSGLSGPAVGAPAETPCEKIVSLGRGFSAIEMPLSPTTAPSPDGEPRALFYAVDPVDADRIYAASDVSVQRSLDGGCTWKEVFHVPVAGGASPTFPCEGALREVATLTEMGGCARITDLDVGPTAETRNRLFVQVSTFWASTSQALVFGSAHAGFTTSVFHSDDGGDTFDLAWGTDDLTQLSLVRGAGPLHISPTDPNTMYLLRADDRVFDGAFVQRIYVSRDGGVVWSEKTAPGTSMQDFTLDPRQPGLVWATATVGVEGSGLMRSTDFGATWRAVSSFPADAVSIVDIASEGMGPSAPTGVLLSNQTLYLTPNGGDDWREVPIPYWAPPSGYIVFGKSARWLFIVGKGKDIARFDLGRSLWTMIKEAPLGDNEEDQQAASYVPGAGLYWFSACEQETLVYDPSCTYLARYTGRGT